MVREILYSDGRMVLVTYHDTGASKTLFALRPNVAAPWDEKIRVGLWSRGIRSYQDFLGDVAEHLRSLAREAGVEVRELPRLVGRPRSSPPKLIDEYNWVVYAVGGRPGRSRLTAPSTVNSSK